MSTMFHQVLKTPPYDLPSSSSTVFLDPSGPEQEVQSDSCG